MQPTERVEFVRVLNGMAAMKRVDLTSEAIDLWWQAMRHWPLDAFKAAASHLVSSHEWMPSPFHFEQLRRAGEPTAGEAWRIVLSGAQLEPGSRMQRAAEIVGGQTSIRRTNIERDLPHVQRRFMEVYDELKDVDASREALPGVSDHPRLKGLGKLLEVL